MKKLSISLVLALLLVLGIVSAVLAVTNGVPDAGRHPYVGILIFEVDGVPSWRCSGALLSPTVVLTAGHCTEGATAARIWFDDRVYSTTETPAGEYPFGGETSYEGTAYTNPEFCHYCLQNGAGLPNYSYRDVGVVVLSEPVPTSVVSEYAVLPSVNLVDTLANKTPVDLVGYGVQYQVPGGGQSPREQWRGIKLRMYAPSELIQGNFKHSGEYLRIGFNPGGGSGGTCFGDSGGPDLLGETNVVLGVNSYVTNSNCSGAGYSTRVDTPDVLAWIQSFLQ